MVGMTDESKDKSDVLENNGVIGVGVNESNNEGLKGISEAVENGKKIHMIRVKFLRVARRLGQTPHNVVVAQLEAPVKNRLSSRAPSWFLGKQVLGKQVLGKVGLLIDEVKFGTY
ncbi:hypothetical protein Tco_1468005 [Tanacetum coccineum]